MSLFSYKCPRCGRVSLVDPRGKCVNRLNNGNVCGFEMALQYDNANYYFRGKLDKHTNKPPVEFSGTWSWVDGRESYERLHLESLTQGTVSLDPKHHYLFLWHKPASELASAWVMYADAGTVARASGIISALTTRLQDIHSYFGNWDQSWKVLASGHDLVIEAPNEHHQRTYVVYSGEKVVASYNLDTDEFFPK